MTFPSPQQDKSQQMLFDLEESEFSLIRCEFNVYMDRPIYIVIVYVI